MAETLVDPLAPWRAGSTEPWTAELIGALVNAKGPKIALETGTFEGRTTQVIAQNMHPGAKLVTVECDRERAEDAGKDFLDPDIQLVCADIMDFLQNWDGPAFEFIFVDDDHDAAHVAAELDAILDHHRPGGRLIAPGGLIIIHDVVGPFGLGPVVRARHGFILDLPRLHVAGGLGLIQIPE